MPWKIVNLDYACERPHLHMKDPQSPIHLRSYFQDQEVEIGLGDDEPDFCFVRARVSPDVVKVEATKFEPLHLQILQSIFASLDVEPEERDQALGWMKKNAAGPRDSDGFLPGNIAAFPPPTGWPYDLTDASLLDSIRDSDGIPSTRRRALEREAVRRGLRPAPQDRGPREPRGGSRPGPEIIRRR